MVALFDGEKKDKKDAEFEYEATLSAKVFVSKNAHLEEQYSGEIDTLSRQLFALTHQPGSPIYAS